MNKTPHDPGEPFTGKGEEATRPLPRMGYVRQLLTADDIFAMKKLTFARGLLLLVFWSVVFVVLLLLTALAVIVLGGTIRLMV